MEAKTEKFGTAVTCMDGRAIAATHEWMKKTYGVEFIDTLTEPGMNGWLCQNRTNEELKHMQNKLKISIINHGSRVVTVGGHAECAGFPVSVAEHRVAIDKAVTLVKRMLQEFTQDQVTVVGLYSEERWVADQIG